MKESTILMQLTKSFCKNEILFKYNVYSYLIQLRTKKIKWHKRQKNDCNTFAFSENIFEIIEFLRYMKNQNYVHKHHAYLIKM